MEREVAVVLERELLLLSHEVRRDPARVLALLHPDFVEYGSSGREWDRASIAAVVAESVESIHAQDIKARRLGPDAMLVTYRSCPCGRAALRSSTWVRERGQWLLLFHQGTLLPP